MARKHEPRVRGRGLRARLRTSARLSRTMSAYHDDALRQLVELRARDGELSADQKQALVSWPQTDDDLRVELQHELEAAGYDPVLRHFRQRRRLICARWAFSTSRVSCSGSSQAFAPVFAEGAEPRRASWTRRYSEGHRAYVG